MITAERAGSEERGSWFVAVVDQDAFDRASVWLEYHVGDGAQADKQSGPAPVPPLLCHPLTIGGSSTIPDGSVARTTMRCSSQK